MQIRRARPDEPEALLAIQRAASLAAFGHIFPPACYPFPDRDVLELWRNALGDADIDVYVAEVESDVIGSVSLDDEWLRTLYVVPSHWSRGVGAALHDHALARMQARGSRTAKLWTLEENQRARRFYERRGWGLTAATRVVPFPPNPIDVQYAKEL